MKTPSAISLHLRVPLLCSGDAMPAIDFRQLRALVSMKEVLELLGFVPLSRAANQLRGAWPLHESTSAAALDLCNKLNQPVPWLNTDVAKVDKALPRGTEKRNP